MMSAISKNTVLVLAVAGCFVPMQGCKNGPPPLMAARLLMKGGKDQNGGPINQGDLLKLTKSTDGTATKGEDFKVALAAKAGDGYEWQCRTPNDAYLLVDASFETAPEGKVAPGTDVQTIYHLHARGVGKTKIEFALVSLADKNIAPKQVITLEVEVKQGSSTSK
jgi:predicted secreted protein